MAINDRLRAQHNGRQPAARNQACLGVQYFDAADFAQRIADGP
jgi:hypothetical protein